MFSIKNCISDKDDDIHELNKFKFKMENERIKIHAKYISFISLAIVVWMIATGTANNTEFSTQLEFASTITSIILSVIAIFMSISGESKMDSIMYQMEDAVEELDKIVKNLEKENESSVESSRDLQESIRELDKKIAGMPDRVIEKMENKFGISNQSQTVDGIKIGWVSNNGK